VTGSGRRPKAKVTDATGADHESVGSDVLDALYPARRILNLIGDKWTPVVLYCLSIREVRRFNEMQRQIPDISKKMLIQTLRALEHSGLLARKVYAEVPPKTEYRLTESGRKLREPIAQLCAWAVVNEKFISSVLAKRAAGLAVGRG
jgi:DNA-binding HxlR family transcriptional regulator